MILFENDIYSYYYVVHKNLLASSYKNLLANLFIVTCLYLH